MLNDVLPDLKDNLCNGNLLRYKFLQDNAPSHRAGATKEWLTNRKVTLVNHPPQSPDLNPIEFVWNIMKDYVESKKPLNEQELRKYI